jgi:polysaccharide export outer membrane protein
MLRCAALFGVIALVAGCAGPPQLGGAPNLTILNADDLPAPDREDVMAMDRPYLVGPFDKLTIDVFGIEELSQREVQVDASGRISFPLAGVVEVAGKTPGEIEDKLRTLLAASYVRNPQVTVNLKETTSQVVTVEGQVKKPGLYPVIGRLTLLRAVALAEGTTEFSKLNQVVIFRTVKGQDLAALYSIKAIRVGAYKDPEVYANDVVVVGDSVARRTFKDVLQVLPLLTTPLIVGIDRFGK